MEAKKKGRKPLTAQSEKTTYRYPEITKEDLNEMILDGPGSEVPYKKTQVYSVEPQDDVQDSLSSRQVEETEEKEEKWELDICFRGYPGKIILKKSTEETRNRKGRLRE